MKKLRVGTVKQIMIRRIIDRLNLLRTVKNRLNLLFFLNSHSDLEQAVAELSDDVDLDSDRRMLRDLEAEIYALTDHFNTEQANSEVRSA